MKYPVATLVLLSPLLLLAQPVVSEIPVQTYQYKVIAEYPQDPNFFTQGLEFHQGYLYASSGIRGKSALVIRDLSSLQPLRIQYLEKHLFGEGITIVDDKVYQLTWQSGRGFIYQANDLRPLGEFNVQGDGWGLTNNGQQLIYSDGSSKLRFINTENFAIEKEIIVRLNGKPIDKLNELEWVDGLIYANIWQSNWIVIINPEEGHIIAKVRLNDLLPSALRTDSTDVLNGIAYDKVQKRLLVSGKNWPRLYHIELYPRSSRPGSN